MSDYFVEAESAYLAENGTHFFLHGVPRFSVATPSHMHEAVEMIYVTAGNHDFYINEQHYLAGGSKVRLRPRCLPYFSTGTSPIISSDTLGTSAQ